MPGRQRSFYSGPRKLARVRHTPIRIQPSPERPIKLHRKNLFRMDLAQPGTWFFILHRRGPRRVMIGEDPNEARAVPKEKVRGTILERIIWQWLTDRKEEFSFQTAVMGGRQELGGLVADFILPFRKIILNPIGPTHDVFVQRRKDDEQRLALEQMGYRVFFIPQEKVLNEFWFEATMRSILDLNASSSSVFSPQQLSEDYTLPHLYDRLLALHQSVKSLALP